MDELHGIPGNMPGGIGPNDAALGLHEAFGFETGAGTESIFSVGVKRGHNGDSGVNLEAGNGTGTGTNDESFNKKFVKSRLLRIVENEVEVGGVTGSCRLGTEVMVEGNPHGRLGKTFDEPELELDIEAEEEDIECGIGTT